jgi:hypothetical protein
LQKQKRDYEAFLEGYKPALTIKPTSSKYFTKVAALDFPRISPFDIGPDSHIFFQTEEQKEDYQNRIEGIQWGTYDFHLIVGETLGFPKKSVEYFAKVRDLENKLGYSSEEEKMTSIGVTWAGFYFASHIDVVEQEVKWLFDTYQHEKAIGLPVSLWTKETDTIEVGYGDLGRVKAIADTIKAFREQKAAVTA